MIHPDDPAKSYPEFLNGAVLLRTACHRRRSWPGCIGSRPGSAGTAAGETARWRPRLIDLDLIALEDRRQRRRGPAPAPPEMHKRDSSSPRSARSGRIGATRCWTGPPPSSCRICAPLSDRRARRQGQPHPLGGVQELGRHPDMVGADQRRSFLHGHQAGQLRQRIALGQRHAEEALARDADQRPGTASAAPPAPRTGPAAPSCARAPGSGTCPSRGRARSGRRRCPRPWPRRLGRTASRRRRAPVAIVRRPVGRVRQRPVLGVHHDQDRPQIADHGRHLGVGAQGRDIVDDPGAQLDAARGRGRMVGVDREDGRRPSARTTGSSRASSSLARDRPAAGCGQFAAQIEHVRAVGKQLPAMRHGGVGRQMPAAVAERVRASR